ncbi:MAG: hypothetical protein M0T80_08610 [Actinomycetota bacterium]|nr:hypothetical protein [Actinomycetota bacterium]
MLPFWGLEFLGWVVSTVAVDIAGQVSAGAGLGHLETTGAVAFAYVASFGVLWLGRFPVLDRVVFAEPTEVLEGA